MPANSLAIYGGTSSIGTLAIQFVKISGKVITTYSEAKLKLGAGTVFNYHDPNVGRQIQKYTHNALALVFDTISIL